MATLSVALVAVLVGLRLATGGLDLETALVVLLLAPEAYWPLRRVGAEFHAAAEGTATFEAADALLTEAREAHDARPVTRLRTGGPGVALRDVTVRYPGRTASALAGLSLHLAPRGLTAVTGPSGCGKSTLLAVLAGRLAPEAGEVLVDGTVTGDATRWPDQVAWMPQRPWLMPATVRDNVRLGRADADDAEVWAALEQVRLAHHVASLPDGLDTVLAEDGASFSAGERARLALARVVVSDRPWVLLDEPTAHLDAETEAVVADTLVRLAEDRAVVVVAHRESLVALADHVVALPSPAAVEPAAAPPVVASSVPRATTHGTDDVPGSRADTPSPAVVAVPATDVRRRLLLGTVLGALAGAAGVALTATAGWLIVRSAEHPPVLLLIGAIVGVRTFGLARPALRYVERLVSHDAVLRLLAEQRAAVYDRLVPLVPGRLGPHRGDVLSSVVDDVDTALDGHLRVRAPLASGALVVAGTTAFAALVAPAAAAPVAVAALVGGGAALLLSWLSARRAERAFVAARGRLSARVAAVLDGAADLGAWQAGDRAAGAVVTAGQTLAGAARGAAAGAATGRAVAVVAAGAGVVAVLEAGAPAYAAGALSGPMLALLALLPLALLDVLLPLADVGPLAVRVRAARLRLDALAGLEPAVTDPAEAQAAGPGSDVPPGRGGRRLGRHPGADRARPGPPRGRPGRSGGPVRVGQVHPGRPDAALPRPGRRHRDPRRDAARPARPRRRTPHRRPRRRRPARLRLDAAREPAPGPARGHR